MIGAIRTGFFQVDSSAEECVAHMVEREALPGIITLDYQRASARPQAKPISSSASLVQDLKERVVTATFL